MFRLFILIRVLHKKGKTVLTRLTEGFPAVTLFCKITAEEEGRSGRFQPESSRQPPERNGEPPQHGTQIFKTIPGGETDGKRFHGFRLK